MDFEMEKPRRSARIQAKSDADKSVNVGKAESSNDHKYSISQPVRRSLRLQKHKEDVQQFHCHTCAIKFDNEEDFREHKEKVHIEDNLNQVVDSIK